MKAQRPSTVSRLLALICILATWDPTVGTYSGCYNTATHVLDCTVSSSSACAATGGYFLPDSATCRNRALGFPSPPPSLPASPRHPPSFPPPPFLPPAPPLPPTPPLAPNALHVSTAAALRVALASAASGSTITLFVPPGATLALSGIPIVVDAVHLVLTSAGVGATLDAHFRSRCIEVKNGGSATLDYIRLRRGRVVDQAGGCALVTGSNSTLTLANGALVECRALLEQFVPTRLTVHGGPYGEFDAASGGGVAAVDGSHLAIRHSDLSNCHADVYGGAVLAYGGANATVVGSSLHRNTASYGSAIASLGSGTYALIDGCNILGRDTVWSVGAGLSRQCGAAAVAYDAEAAVVDSLIANHTQLHGGAAFCAGAPRSGLTLTGTTVRDTHGTFAVLFMGMGPLVISQSRFLRCIGGAFFLLNGPTVTMTDSLIEGGYANSFAGGVTQFHGSFSARNLTVRDCHSVVSSPSYGGTAGGLDFKNNGRRLRLRVVLEDSHIDGCTGVGAPGGVYVAGADVVVRRTAIRDCHSVETSGGGVRVGNRGVVHLIESSISRCSAATHGGSAAVEEGGVLTLLRSSITNSTAMRGGLLAAVGGTALLEDAVLSRGQTLPVRVGTSISDEATNGGGCLYAAAAGQQPAQVGANVTLIRSVLSSCIAGVAGEENATAILTGDPCYREDTSYEEQWRWPTLSFGSGVYTTGAATSVRLIDSQIVDSVAQRGGGAYVYNGRLLLERSSAIARCTACNYGGGVSINRGRLQMTSGSEIRDCLANGHGGGGIQVAAASHVDLTDATIARCSAPYASGAAIKNSAMSDRVVARNLTVTDCLSGASPSSMAGAGPSSIDYLVATVLTITPSCVPLGQTAPPVIAAPSRLPAVRGLRVVPYAGCAVHADTTNLLAAAFGNLSAWATEHTCGTTGVCAEHAACTDVPVTHRSSLTSPWCSCSPPNVHQPGEGTSEELRAFTHGCATPRFGRRVEVAGVTSASVVLRLTKPENASRRLVLETGGTAEANVTWSIEPASVPSWLSLDTLSGQIYLPWASAASNQAGDSHRVLTLVASTAGLAESSLPYQAVLNFTANSMLKTRFEVPVLFFVSAIPHAATSVWGHASSLTGCYSDAMAAATLEVTIGQPNLVPFTACDMDALPVAHALPERFTATLTPIDGAAVANTSASSDAIVRYCQSWDQHCQHAVELSPPRVGRYELMLDLDGVRVGRTRQVVASCRVGKVALDGGRACGCPAGSEPNQATEGSATDTPCSPCSEGFHKDRAGDMLCEKEEVAVLPIVFATLGAVMGGVLLLLCGYGGRRQYQRYQQALRAAAAALGARRERCKRAVDAMQELRFAFCLVRFTDLRESKEFMRHERLLDLGQLKYLHTMHDAVAFSAAHPVLFCSHQWLHGRHPDPDGVQHAALISACEELCAQQKLEREELYVWLDYSSVPQSNRSMQLAAISSLHAYAACAKYFVAVVPPTTHKTTGSTCDRDSYSRRGWCRLEQMAYVLIHGVAHAYIHDATTIRRLGEQQGWLESAIDVFGADFTCPSDKELLVDVLLGLFGFALLGRGSEAGEGAVGDGGLFTLIEQRKGSVFPEAYFEDLIVLLERGLEDCVKAEVDAQQQQQHGALFGEKELGRLLQARQAFLAIQGRSLASNLTKRLNESAMHADDTAAEPEYKGLHGGLHGRAGAAAREAGVVIRVSS